jgi:hypothetical protein
VGIGIAAQLGKIHRKCCSLVQGSVFRSENDIYPPPPPSENVIFPPYRDTSFFDSHSGLFALTHPYFAFILPFTSPYLIFFPLSSFFLFAFSYFFTQMTSADIPPPLAGVFSNI